MTDYQFKYLMDYPSSKLSQWSNAKISLYTENIVRMFYDNKYVDYLTSFIGMVKKGEVYSYEEGKAYVDK